MKTNCIGNLNYCFRTQHSQRKLLSCFTLFYSHLIECTQSEELNPFLVKLNILKMLPRVEQNGSFKLLRLVEVVFPKFAGSSALRGGFAPDRHHEIAHVRNDVASSLYFCFVPGNYL